jgi:membrane associated rhomboid family serine protease
MGIYDREYYRRETPSFLGSFTGRGTICKWLIGANVAFFIVQMLTRDNALGEPLYQGQLTEALWLNFGKVLHGEVWRLLTYAFLHDVNNPLHIIFNMLFLWWFGSDMEDLYGPREFLAFYLTAALGGGVACCLAEFLGFGGGNVLGASGAVTAVMVLCAIHYPTRVIRLFFFLPIPIWLFVVFQVAQDVFTLLGKLDTGVAVACHVGGAAFGLLYYKMHWRISSLWPESWTWGRRRGRQGRLRVFREEETKPRRAWAAPEREEGAVQAAQDVVGVKPAAPGSSLALADEHLEAQMDAILEKISRVGKQNLTEDELEVLRRASEALKRRRR